MIFLGIVAVCGCTTSDTQTFSSNGISFNYPSNWTKMNPSDITTDTLAYVYDTSDNKTVFTVRLLSPQLTNADLNSLNVVINLFKTTNQNLTQFSILSEKAVTINGLNGYEIVYTFYSSYAGFQKQNKAVILEKTPGSTYYFLVGETASQNYNQLIPTFDRIINSFKG